MSGCIQYCLRVSLWINKQFPWILVCLYVSVCICVCHCVCLILFVYLEWPFACEQLLNPRAHMHEICFLEDSRPDGSPAWEAEALAAAGSTASAAESEREGDGRYRSRLGSCEWEGRDNKQPLACPFTEWYMPAEAMIARIRTLAMPVTCHRRLISQQSKLCDINAPHFAGLRTKQK